MQKTLPNESDKQINSNRKHSRDVFESDTETKQEFNFPDFEMSYSVIDDNNFSPLHLILFSRTPQQCIAEFEKIKLRDIEKQREIINKETELGFTILLFAVMIGNIDIIKSLLTFDVIDINCCSEDAITPLNLATALQNIEIIKLLVEKKACANTTPTNIRSPIFMAITLGNIDILTLFIEKGYISKFYEYYQDTSGHNEFDIICPFKFSIDTNNEIIHQLLLNECTENLKFLSHDDGTSLMYAIHRQNIDLVKQILEKGGKELIDYTADGYCRSSLFCAIDAKNDEIFDLLMSYEPELLLIEDGNILEYTIKEHYQHGIEILSQNNELVNLVDSYGRSALHYAVVGDRTIAIDTINFYLSKGIDRAIEDIDGKTAFDYAEENNDTEIMSLVKVIEPK